MIDERSRGPSIPIAKTRIVQAKAKEGRMTTVWIYVDTSKQVGDIDHLKVFVDEATADTWLAENDPEGMAFEYEVLE